MADNKMLGFLTPITLPEAIFKELEPWSSRLAIRFSQDTPRDQVNGATITWRLINRLPGKGPVESRKPRLRFQHSISPSDIAKYWIQWNTLTYQFDLYDVSNEAVNKLAEDWDSLILGVVPALKEKGVDEFLFIQQLEDSTLKKDRQDEYYIRSFRYLCILPLYYVRKEAVVRDVVTRVYSSHPDKLTLTRSSARYDEISSDLFSVVQRVYKHQSDGSDFVYQFGIDYTLFFEPDAKSQIYWLDYGATPAQGETYYVEGVSASLQLEDTHFSKDKEWG